MSGRYFLLIPALFIDGLQALLSLGLAGLFTTIGGVLALIPIVGGVLAAGVIPTGLAFGLALNFIVSATFGALLLTLLATSGILYPRYLVSGGGELIPGLNNLPFWTLLTLLCILQKNREEKEPTKNVNGKEEPAPLAKPNQLLQDVRPGAKAHA